MVVRSQGAAKQKMFIVALRDLPLQPETRKNPKHRPRLRGFFATPTAGGLGLGLRAWGLEFWFYGVRV